MTTTKDKLRRVLIHVTKTIITWLIVMPEETQNDIQPDAQDERRPVDYSREAAGYTEEATELLAQIKQAEPKYTRDEQLQTVIDLLDKSHERSVKAYIDLQNDE